jgi:hypothetical protein
MTSLKNTCFLLAGPAIVLATGFFYWPVLVLGAFVFTVVSVPIAFFVWLVWFFAWPDGNDQEARGRRVVAPALVWTVPLFVFAAARVSIMTVF